MSPYSGPRNARRRDLNENALIANALAFAHDQGFELSVEKIDEKGVPDLLIGMLGRNVLAEVKNPEQSPANRKLTPDQKTWWGDWRGQKALVETPEDIGRLIARAEAGAHVERLAPFVADVLAGMMSMDVDDPKSMSPDAPITKLREFVRWTRATQEETE